MPAKGEGQTRTHRAPSVPRHPLALQGRAVMNAPTRPLTIPTGEIATGPIPGSRKI